MEKVTSADGTPIAFERYGEGDPVVLVGGALCDRASHRPLARLLASDFTAVTYDRRGRGDSGDSPSYAVEREVEDIAALIRLLGGSASIYGHSSGACLAFHAAAAPLSVTSLVLHEPPYIAGEGDQDVSRRYSHELSVLLSDGRGEEAVELFLTKTGMPAEAIEQMRREPWWPAMVSMAHTLAYESEVVGDRGGGAVPMAELGRVEPSTLVLTGAAGPDWMVETGARMTEGMPRGHHEILEGAGHDVPPDVLAPILIEFLGKSAGSR